MSNWRDKAGATFDCEKSSARAAGGMVVTNHPLASAAGAEMLAAGGNAIDAAIASLFALNVVEPMMVGMLGGGMAHIRLASGEHVVVDGLGTAPLAATADMYEPVSDTLPDYLVTKDRANAIGASSVAVPGNLLAWHETLTRYGTLSLADVMEPAIRHASCGFAVTPYLSECIDEAAPDLARDPQISRRFMPDGKPLQAGARLLCADTAETLRTIARAGPEVMYGGAIGAEIASYLERAGSCIRLADFEHYTTKLREPVRGTYRGFDVVGPPPPSSSGVHIVQMLNVLERHDLASLGFGTADSMHLILEVLKLAFADRNAATADPDFVDVPVETLLSKAYADECAQRLDPRRAQSWSSTLAHPESPNTTHLTVADRDGNVVASTQTINSTFGARILIPGVGLIPNNYMAIFDPHPGHALSIAPGKRVTTSQAPLIVLKDGQPAFALGLPGGLRIFGSVLQTIINIIDHGMSLQEAVEAPRIWTQGDVVEVETGIAQAMRDALTERGHRVTVLPHIGGGMNAIAFHGRAAQGDTELEGAACWRADGTAVGLAGGHARAGVRFWPDAPKA